MRLTGGCLASSIRFVSFDAMDTLIRPRLPIWVTYQQFAHKQKLDFDENLLKDCFLRTYRAFSQLYPCFGNSKQHPLIIEGAENVDVHSDRHWWRAVVRGTFNMALEKTNQSHKCFEYSDQINRLATVLYDHFCTGDPWFIYPDTERTLQSLKMKKLRPIVLSNWDFRLARVLEDLHLLQYFEALFLSGDLGYAKPDPHFFKIVQNSLEIHEPSEMLHIGDDVHKDYLAATELGFQALLLVYELDRFNCDPGLPLVPKDRVITHIEQVLKFV